MNYSKIYNYLKKAFLTGSLKTIVVALTTIIFLPLIIRELGLETYGIVSLVMIFGSLVAFSDFGMAKSITMLVGHYKENQDLFFSNGLYFNLLLILFFLICTLIIIFFNFQIFGTSLTLEQDIQNSIIISGFLILTIMTLNNVLIALLEVNYLSHYVNIFFMLSSVLFHIILYVFSISYSSLYFIIYAPVVASFLSMMYLVYIVYKHINIKLTKPNINTIKYMTKSSLGFFKLSIINSITIPISKYLLIYLSGNTSLLAILDIAIKISLIATSFLNSISQPLFGIFANHKNQKNEIYSFTIKISLLIFMLFIFGNTFFYFTGEYIIQFIDKRNFLEIFNITLIILFFITLNAVSEPAYRAFISQNYLNEMIKIKIVIPIFNLILILSLYFFNFDILFTITWAFGISYFIGTCLLLVYFKNKKERFIA